MNTRCCRQGCKELRQLGCKGCAIHCTAKSCDVFDCNADRFTTSYHCLKHTKLMQWHTYLESAHVSKIYFYFKKNINLYLNKPTTDIK